jgi:hypothetical protein
MGAIHGIWLGECGLRSASTYTSRGWASSGGNSGPPVADEVAVQDSDQDGDGRRRLEIGALQAEDLGSQIELQSGWFRHVLVAEIAGIRHEGQYTELALKWDHRQTIVLQQDRRDMAALLPLPDHAIPPEGGWVYRPAADEETEGDEWK